ncbi:MAG: hypothetical protein R3F62_06030 [Planctomycetota bacterium]
MELRGFAPEAPPAELRERVLAACAAEARSGGWGAIGLYLLAIAAVLFFARAVNLEIAARAEAAFGTTHREPQDGSLRLAPAAEGLRRRALSQLHTTSERG